MLKQGLFKVEFKVYNGARQPVNFTDEMTLPYHTGETFIHFNSTARKWASIKAKEIFPGHIIDIKKINILTEFEEIK